MFFFVSEITKKKKIKGKWLFQMKSLVLQYLSDKVSHFIFF